MILAQFFCVVGLFFSSMSAAPTNEIESAPYKVIRSENGYEVRVYPATKWVRTRDDNGRQTMFWKLFNYISGTNDRNAKIEMTSPVSMYTEPEQGPKCETMYTMAFYIPNIHQNSPPNPSDPNVSIEERPAMTVFVRTYGGFSNEDVAKEEYRNLLQSLNEQDKKTINPNGPYYSVGYDPPFKLTDRRNEIWIVSREVSQTKEPNVKKCGSQ